MLDQGYRSIYLSAANELTSDLSPSDLESAVTGGKGVLWLDLRDDGPEAQRLLTDVMGFHHLAIEDCFNGVVDTPKVDDYRDYLFIIAQSVVFDSATARLDLGEVAIFLGANYVVTLRPQPLPAIDELFQTAQENQHILDRGADFLAHTILDTLVDLMLPAVEEMDEKLDELMESILEEPQKHLLSQVLLLKRNTLRLRRSILPQRDMVNRLSRGEFSHLIDGEALIFFRDVYDHTVRVEEILDSLRDLADSALSSYLSVVNNRLNEVMRALSVVSAVFLPLTLIASIYGTNLDLSPLGLEFEHGFMLMIALMLVIAGFLIAYFRRRGWI